MRAKLRAFLLLYLLAVSASLGAHNLAPSLLEIKVNGEQATLSWKLSTANRQRLQGWQLVLPNQCESVLPGQWRQAGDYWWWHLRLRCPQASDYRFEQQSLALYGLSPRIDKVLLHYHSGASSRRVLLSAEREHIVLEASQEPLVWADYFYLGMQHFALGFDHVLWLVCLLLLIVPNRQRFWAVSAFTLGHSLTLIGASFGWFEMRALWVELGITLSLVWMAAEVVKTQLKQSYNSLLKPRFVIIPALFGLLHGLGFAGVLSQIGLPEESLLLSLVLFNVGLEVAQIVLVLVVVSVGLGVRHWQVSKQNKGLTLWLGKLKLALAYIIGALGVYWFSSLL